MWILSFNKKLHYFVGQTSEYVILLDYNWYKIYNYLAKHNIYRNNKMILSTQSFPMKKNDKTIKMTLIYYWFIGLINGN